MPAPRYAVLADDLTGACDAGIHFAEHGLSTVVWLAATPPPAAAVVVLSTASRGDSPEAARAKVRAALARAAGRELVFKKIDSTLRGNIVDEIQACGFEEAWIAPAYPALGRQLIGGRLYVNGAPLRQRLDPAAGIRVLDAATQEELAAVARDAFALPTPPLLAGSGGLAVEVARRLGCPEPVRGRIRGRKGPVVLYIGSTHTATAAQMAILKVMHPPEDYRLVRIKTLEGELAAPVARYQARDAAGLVMTGGDTAALALRALGAHGIRLFREVAAGVPYGAIMGGPFNGTPLITKAGGFGGEGVLSLCVEVLRKGLT